jgi:hypothetical protein
LFVWQPRTDHDRDPVRHVELCESGSLSEVSVHASHLFSRVPKGKLAGILMPTTAEEAELDTVVATLEAWPLVLSVTWSVEAAS